ncbi:hypothetical protein LTR17_000197 [Elasticomyces elasticus]|nr:hypothetical protein LTR17_000197 [Elasticomyces elasticus]
MKWLLTPLLVEQELDRIDYEKLLEHPGGPGWRNDNVDAALSRRLAESQEQYMDVLGKMVDALSELSTVFRIDDPQFQELLTQDTTSCRNARTALMTRANVLFQARRVRYSFGDTRREELLTEVERCNTVLEGLVVMEDRISAAVGSPQQSAVRRASRESLQHWNHAESFFRLLREAWLCHCRTMHCAHLWLEPRTVDDFDLNFLLKFCHDSTVIEQVPQWTKLATRAERGRGPLQPIQVERTQTRPNTGSRRLPHSAKGASSSAVLISTSTLEQASPSNPACPPAIIIGHPSVVQPLQDLCITISQGPHSACFATLNDDENGARYSLSPTIDGMDGEKGLPLAAVLRRAEELQLTRAQRYTVAAALACSHLKYYDTLWLQHSWSSHEIYLPIILGAGGTTVSATPYIVTLFQPRTSAGQQSSTGFLNLAILLLELCFGTVLESRPEWRRFGVEAHQADPQLRQMVADQWLHHVAGEAGELYEQAVKWTLREAPIDPAKDKTWRNDFAVNVVAPLQQCYEAIRPSA